MEPIGQLGLIQIDCRDPVALATFWGVVLGLQVDDDYLGDPPHYVGLMATNPDHPQVNFQRVPETKTLKNRLHFDIRVGDVDKAASRIEALGDCGFKRKTSTNTVSTGASAADPEGNEFF